jgi:parvulin-like peptidyl-prolyl isomerase
VRRALVFAVVVAVVAAAGCARRGEDEVLARVEGSTLSVEEFYASIPEDLLAVMSLDDQEEALRTWVKTELFYQEGLRRGIADDEDLQRRLAEIERELVAEEYIRRFMEGVPDVTDDEARAYFDDHSSEYAIQVRLAHILVRNRQEAERALSEIHSGTPFETIAASVSIDQTASLGGDLGYMRRGEMIHELEGVAFDLNVGEVSDVIPSSYGYHIVKVLDRHPGAGQPTFESKHGAVMNFLTSVRRREAFDRRLTELEGLMHVVVDTARLRAAARARIEAPDEVEYKEESGDLSPDEQGEGTP